MNFSDKNIFSYYDQYFLNTYNRFHIIFVKGEGKYLYDINGKRYLDFFCGLSVSNLGHCNKKLLTVLKRQSNKLWHISNFYYHTAQIELAKLLIKKTFPARVFFSNSGAEANECAIKLVRKYGNSIGKYEIITFKNSFHGRTIATVTATGQQKFQTGFEPLLEGFKYAEFNNITSVKKLISNRTVAIMLEPIQGEGGVIPAEKKFLEQLRDLCNQKKLILIFDEVQTGYGRTGELFAYQYYKVKPDIITMAKSVANGLPLGITLVDEKYASVFNFGDHGSTFGGNILSCTVATEVLKLIDTKLLKNVKIVGEYFLSRLVSLKKKYKFIKDVRGVGLMVGMELTFPCREVVQKCLQKGILINVTQDKVLRFLPPLIITTSDVDFVVSVLDEIFKEY